MNAGNISAILDLILKAQAAGMTEVPVILKAYNALKAEAGMTDDQLAESTQAMGENLDLKILAEQANLAEQGIGNE